MAGRMGREDNMKGPTGAGPFMDWSLEGAYLIWSASFLPGVK